MKNSTRHKRYLRMVSITLIAVSLTQGCSPDFLESDPGRSNPEEGVLTMSYEAEMLTYQPIGSDEKAPVIDRIGAMAKSARTRISVQIYEDGTSDWTMEKLTPKRNTLMKDLTPPNPMPQTQKTRILRSGTGYFYDAQGGQPAPHRSRTYAIICADADSDEAGPHRHKRRCWGEIDAGSDGFDRKRKATGEYRSGNGQQRGKYQQQSSANKPAGTEWFK